MAAPEMRGKCGYELDCAGHWFGSEKDAVELIWILAGRQVVSSSVEGEPDEHEAGRLRRLEKIWNRCYWEHTREGSDGGMQKVCLVSVKSSRDGVSLICCGNRLFAFRPLSGATWQLATREHGWDASETPLKGLPEGPTLSEEVNEALRGLY